MALTEALAIGPLGPEAVTQGCELTAEVGWNQTAEDWAFFLQHGTVLGAREREGHLVGTAAVLPYSAGFAWVSLVIVTRTHRGQDLGTRMLNQCIDLLRSRGVVGVLDATLAGERVYAPLGFKPLFGLNRWIGESSSAGTAHSEGVRPLLASDARSVAADDLVAFGSEREALLTNFLGRAGTFGCQLADRAGYAILRRGRMASQLGPVVAGNERDALALIEACVAFCAGPLLIDVPEAWPGIAAWLTQRGFAIQRRFLRMALGRDVPYGEPARVFAIAGPEYG